MLEQDPSPTVLVVGHGPLDAQAALDLADAGAGVTLLTAGDWLTPGTEGLLGMPPLLEAARHPRIKLLTGATVERISDAGGDLRAAVCQSPRYVDPTRCTACGACVEVCPITFPGDNGQAPHKAIYRAGVPTVYAIDKAGMAPCRHACPIDQRAQGYVALVRAGQFEAAYRTIKRENPFPSVCGRVCNHRCEEACTRCQIDEAVAVMALKRFVADWAWEHRPVGIPRSKSPRSGYRVAVVGAGPAGLTAAREMGCWGHDVTVLEALPVPGGMMRVGIPSFRLPRERLQWEIDEVLGRGIELRTNTRVEDVENLFADGYDAVILAVGLHKSRPLSLPGMEEPPAERAGEEAWPGVMGAVEFLREVNLGQRPDWRGRQVVVVGGGSTAMDTARFCRRLGAQVTVIYRRSRAEMPAHESEVEDALREGVTIRMLTNPTRVLRDAGGAGGVTAVECLCMELGEPDESGRRRPIPIAGSEFTLPADRILLAIGQVSDLSCLCEDGAVVQRRGIVEHDPASWMTGRPGLFVAGDVAGSAGFVVDAIASGLQVARSVDRYLRGAEGVAEPVQQPVVELADAQVAQRLAWAAPRGSARTCTHSTSPEALLGDFKETAAGLSETEARTEAGRCLSCGLCSECLACVEACPANAIDHNQPARSFEIAAGAVIWDDSVLEPSAAALPGLYVVGDHAGPGAAVDQALARLDLARAAPSVAVVAPSLWQFAPRVPLHYDAGTQNARIGVFLCRCGGEIGRAVDLAAVAARVEGLPGVAYVGQIDFACHPEGNAAIRATLEGHELGGAVLAACSCCALDQVCYSCTTQRMRCKERLGIWDGLQGLPLQFVNVREQCAFVHRDAPSAATRKAGDLVAAAVGSLAVTGGGPDGRDGSASRMPITATIDLLRCRGCEDCEDVCGLEAMQVVRANGVRVAQVDATRCLGCGVCMAVCSSGAIAATDVSDARAEAALAAMGDLSAKTVVFSCNWGGYSAVEAAGVGRLQYDPAVRLMRLMCAGRAHEGLILRAFAQGAARVLVLACGHERDASRPHGGASQCYYHTGNDQATRSVEQTRRLLALLGIDPARLALVEVQPGDGAGFVAAVGEFISATRVALEG